MADKLISVDLQLKLAGDAARGLTAMADEARKANAAVKELAQTQSRLSSETQAASQRRSAAPSIARQVQQQTAQQQTAQQYAPAHQQQAPAYQQVQQQQQTGYGQSAGGGMLVGAAFLAATSQRSGAVSGTAPTTATHIATVPPPATPAPAPDLPMGAAALAAGMATTPSGIQTQPGAWQDGSFAAASQQRMRAEQAQQIAALADPAKRQQEQQSRPQQNEPRGVAFLEELKRRGRYDIAGKTPGVTDAHHANVVSKTAKRGIGYVKGLHEEFGTMGTAAIVAGMGAAIPTPIPGILIPPAARAVKNWWQGGNKPDTSGRSQAELQREKYEKAEAQAQMGQAGARSFEQWANTQQPPTPQPRRDAAGLMIGNADAPTSPTQQATKQAATNLAQLAESTKQQTQSQTQLIQAQQQATTATKQQQAQARANAVNPAAAGQQPGQPGGLMGLGLKAFAYNAAAQHVMGSVTNVANIAQNPILSSSQKGRDIVESMPVVGGLVKSLNDMRDAVNGTTSRLKAMQLQTERQTAEQQFRQSAFQQRMPIEAQRRELGARATELGDEQLRVKFNAPDRDTVEGERKYRSAERRLPLEMEQRKTDVERMTQIEAGRSLDPAIEQKEKQVRSLQGQHREAKVFAEAPGLSKKAEVTRLLAEQQTLNSLKRAEAELATLMEAKQRNISAIMQAQAAHRQAGIALAREELTTLAEREQRVKGGAQQWGGMNEAEKVGALQAAQMAKKDGVAALTQEQQALVERAGGGDFIAKGREQIALKDDNFKAFRGAIGEEADLKQVQKKQVEVQNKIAIDLQTNEAEIAKSIKNALDPVLEKMADAIKRQMEIAIRESRVGQIIRNKS